jgi:sporulation protein YlmC with PRC-barrel domain
LLYCGGVAGYKGGDLVNKFILTHTNGTVTIKVVADVVLNQKNQRIIEAKVEKYADEIADFIDLCFGLDIEREESDGNKTLDSNK